MEIFYPWEGVSSYSTVKNMGVGVGGDGRSGRPRDATTDANVKVVHTLVMSDRRRNLRSIASEVGISLGAIQLILTYILGMSNVGQDGCCEC